MTNNTVIIVTEIDLSWDCVVGVFTGISKEDLEQEFPPNSYSLHQCSIETNLNNY